ncbi:MAG: hypothetical protein WCS87_12035 [Methylococcaceae bacterium]
MKTLLLNSQQLACILDEAHVINTKRHHINVLVHSIEHPDFGMASIIENATGGGVLIYGKQSRHRMG